jgi:GT2 family glycosyltransferase
MCVDSIHQHTGSVSFEVIVIDNASADGSAEAVVRAFPDVRVVKNMDNVGFARGCNQGMALARGAFILLLNSDAYVSDDVVGRSVVALAARPEIGMLGCELRFPDGRRQHTANRALSIRQSLLERLWLYKALPASRRGRTLLGGYWEEDEEIEVDWLAGAFMLLRRELFERTGGFDPRFFMYGEDSEWCMRLRRLGHRILYAPRLGVVYHRGASSSDVLWTDKERLRRCYAGGIEAYEALNGRRRAALFRLAELVGATVRFAVYGAAAALRPGAYYRTQAQFYRWLVAFYLGIG